MERNVVLPFMLRHNFYYKTGLVTMKDVMFGVQA